MRTILRWLFGRCSYCGNLLRKGGGKGSGTPHTVYEVFNSKDKIIKYACLKCEMLFDED